MVLAAFFFATMGVSIKFAAEYFNTAEIIFYRGLISMALLWFLARRQGVTLRTNLPGMHAWRSLVGVTSMAAWFYAIAKLPLATAMTLNYMSSLWIAAFMVGGALMAWRPSPQTAGPLLVSCAPEAVEQVLAIFRAEGFADAAVIGEMQAGSTGVSVL